MRAYRLTGAGRAEVVEVPSPSRRPTRSCFACWPPACAGPTSHSCAAAATGSRSRHARPRGRRGGDGAGEGVAGPAPGRWRSTSCSAVAAVPRACGAGQRVPGRRPRGARHHARRRDRRPRRGAGPQPRGRRRRRLLHAAPMTDAGMTALHAVERARPCSSPARRRWWWGSAVWGTWRCSSRRRRRRPASSPSTSIRPACGTRIARGSRAACARRRRGRACAHGECRSHGRRRVRLRRLAGEPRPGRARHRARRRDRRDRRRRRPARADGGDGRPADTRTARSTMVHTFGGRRPTCQGAGARRAASGRTHVQVFSLDEAGRALAELEAGRLLGRAVVVP